MLFAPGKGASSGVFPLVLLFASLGACAAPEPPKVATVSTDAPLPSASASAAAPESASPPEPAAAASDPVPEKASIPRPDPPDQPVGGTIEDKLSSLELAMLRALSTQGGTGSIATGTLSGTAGGSGGIGGPGAGAVAAGSSAKVTGPVVSATIGNVQVSGGAIANASPVVAGMAPGFRRCAQVAVKQDPASLQTGAGIVMKARIDKNGVVTSVQSISVRGLSAETTKCLSMRVSSAQFAPPDTGTSMIEIPVTFQVQP